ncbi:MAG: hypothetical protein ACWGOW_09735 [Gammaproteobacteria bacterium]
MEDIKLPGIIKGNPRRCMVLVAIAVAFALASEKWFFPWLSEFSTRAHCEEIFGFNGADVLFASLFIGLPCGFLVITIWLAFISLKILKSGQMPPPGSWVCRDTVPKSGRSVIWRAYVGLTFPAIGMALLVWGILSFVDLKTNLLDPGRERLSKTCVMKDNDLPNRSSQTGMRR